jgi:membrane-associated phospholipid phosphatase
MTRSFIRQLRPTLLMYWVVLLVALYVFAQLASEVYERERLFFDVPVLTWFHSIATPFLTELALTLTNIGSVYVLGVALVICIFYLVIRKIYSSKRSVVFLMFSFGGAATLDVIAKAVFARARPSLFTQLIPEHDFSFPSGHTMASAAFFLALYFLSRQLFPRWQWLVAAFGLVLTLGIGLSRLYLQVHHPSDVLAGWALSLLWVLGVNLWYVRSPS